MKRAVNVAITGAAGQIGYALAFRVASGPDARRRHAGQSALLEIAPALPALQGVSWSSGLRLPDARTFIATDDAKVAFRDCHVAMLVGARPRGAGMERKDLLLPMRRFSRRRARRSMRSPTAHVKVLVVGNPANTNALIAQSERARPRSAQLHRDDAAGSQPRYRAARR